MQGYSDADISVHVVWVPMLGGDNETAARDISSMFEDPRVHQYWDPNRLSGTSYSKHVFPAYLQDMEASLEASLPADHWWRQRDRTWKNAKPENAPLWDVAFTYEKGTQWGKHPPEPVGMVKQIFFYGVNDDGPSGMFFTNFKKAPFDTDWIVELGGAMTALIGTAPVAELTTSSVTAALPESLGDSTRSVRAELIVLYVEELGDESKVRSVVAALSAMKGVYRASGDVETKLVQVLTLDADAVTPERVVQYLGMAGYKAKEATPQQYDIVTTAMAADGAIVMRKDSKEESVPPAATSFPDTKAGRTAKAFFESFNSGDSEAVRAFNETYRAASALKARTMRDRLEQYRSLYDDWGELRIRSVADGGEGDISVTVQPTKGIQALEMDFDFEPMPPNKLESIRIMMTFAPEAVHGGKPGSTGAPKSDSAQGIRVTSLADSLNPLRDWFNEEKGKPRFIALLSPT